MSGPVIWLTGLPCSGKTTIAKALRLRWTRCPIILLDGDELRKGLCADLGFSERDRRANLERVAHVAALLSAQGCAVVCSFVSPTRAGRAQVRAILGRLVEVYVDAPVEECIRRDVKGMYAEALDGRRPGFTGVDAPYEPPESPDIIVDTQADTVEQSVERILAYLRRLGCA